MKFQIKNFEDKFSGICRDDPNDGDGGGVDDTSGGGNDTDTSGFEPSSGLDAPNGGANAADAGHQFGTPSNDSQAKVVRETLDKGDDAVLTMEDIQNLLSFNPTLGKGKKEAPTPVADPNAAPDPNAPKLDAEGKPIVEAAPAAVVPQPLDPNVAALIDAMKANAPKPETPKIDTPAKKSYYGGHTPPMQVSPELKAAIFNAEDPAKASQALDMMVNGIMNKVMDDAMTVTSLMLQNMQTQMTKHIPEAVTVQTRAKENSDNFYKEYKELNTPGLQPIVNQYANLIVQNAQKAGMAVNVGSKEFQKALGEAVHKHMEVNFGVKLARAKAAATPNAPAKGQAPAGKKTKFMTQGSSRPPAKGALNGKQSEDLRDFV